MFKVTIYTIGKVKESWLVEGLDEYTTRLKNVMGIEWILAKNLEELTQKVEKLPSYTCLDPAAKLFTSEELALWLNKEFIKGGSRLNLVIGGADGLSEKIRQKADSFLSLSPLTFTHQMTRLILLEQLYRALEIQKGSAYHK